MYNGNHIKELLAYTGRTNKELLLYLGVEGNSSITQLTKGNPTANKLEKIADFFDVPVDDFFIRNQGISRSKDSTEDANHLKEKIKLLEQLLSQKNKIIELLEEKIEARK